MAAREDLVAATSQGQVSSTAPLHRQDGARGPSAPPATPPRQRFFEIHAITTRRQSILLGIAGVLTWLGLWEIAHHLTPAAEQKFLPGAEQVIVKVAELLFSTNYLADIAKSLYRIYVSFAAACLVAVPLGLLMGSFAKVKALVNPTVGGWRYLPAASFVPLLLVYFGPTDMAKMALLFLGCVFFLIALILDDVLAVPKELVESAQTMGASRWHIVTRVIFPAAAPQILDSMRNMIAVSWTYLVIAEIVAATDGIGAVMMRAARFLHVDVIMAGILTIGILGVLTDIAFRQASHALFPYTHRRR
ncbi:MAG: ABC transporter permease [Azospirillaceae bacterium]